MDFQVYDIALIPVIVALVGMVGKAGIPARLLPLVAVVLGLACGFIYVAPSDPRQAALVGIVMGLSAIGAYSGVKNSVQKRE